MAEGFFHGFSGWFIFMFALAILLLEMWILSKIGGERRKAKGERGKPRKKGNSLAADAHRQTQTIEKDIFPDDTVRGNDSVAPQVEGENNSRIEELRNLGGENPETRNEKELKGNLLATDARRHAQTKERVISPADAVRENHSAASQINDLTADNDQNVANAINDPNDPNHLNDTLTVSLKYENGSIGTISYFANGDKSLPKERVEVYAHGCTAVLDDFKELTIFAGGKKKRKKLFSQNKGQKDEVRVFIDAVIEGKEPPIPLEEIFSTSLVTFKILESIQSGQAQRLG